MRPIAFVALALSLACGVASAQSLDATAELMKELTEAPGPSAFEEAVRAVVVREYAELGAQIEYDGVEVESLGIRPGDGTAPLSDFIILANGRYAATGVIQRSDFDQAVELLVQILLRLDAETVTELASFGG